MSTPVKRTVLAVVAAILMAALSSAFAITLARLTLRYATESDTHASDSEARGRTSLPPSPPGERLRSSSRGRQDLG